MFSSDERTSVFTRSKRGWQKMLGKAAVQVAIGYKESWVNCREVSKTIR